MPKPSNPTSLSHHLPKKDLQKIQDMVDSFRRILRKENTHAKRGQTQNDEESAVLSAYLADFRRSLARGEEILLEGNPFYELTKQIYKLCLEGVNQAFCHLKEGEKLPDTVPISRSMKQIWRETSVGKSFWGRVSETLEKLFAFGRTPLSLLLFAGSTYTTARGVNDLLQLPEASALFGHIFEGSSGEGNRYIICLGSGLILSSAILDYKTRIFQSVVESGSILQGIRDAFLRNPRWMILATLLTFVSIKTNYDGIVSIISKKEDLAQQSHLISARVRKALGSPFFMDPLQPDSLFDLQGSFQQTTREIMAVLRALPEDEVKGVASSGDPRKGPRYWAKHFIVHGGYEEGINDVTLAFNDHVFARGIDNMLKNSGIDFSTSFSQKVERLRANYETHLAQTDDLVRKRLQELNAMMSMGGYSLEEIQRVLTLEHYQINDIVQEIVSALENNKQAYKETSEDLSILINAYLDILQTVDKSGTTGLSAYQIKADVIVPRIEAIDELREGKIPIAKHKTFDELRNSLMEKYGVSLGGLILGIVLFFSISMDLGDPIAFGRMTARRGRRDQALLKDRLQKLQRWEEEFLVKVELFFEQQEIKRIFADYQSPGTTMIRNALFKLLEEINPKLMDERDKSLFQRFDHWFQGMFVFSRTVNMAGLNQRVVTIRRMLHKSDRYFPVWGLLIYPGFSVNKAFAKTTFQEWHENIKHQLNERRVFFYQELQDAVQVPSGVTRELPENLSSTQKRLLTRWADKKGLSILSTAMTWGHRVWFLLFHSAPKAPIGGFCHTRCGWLQDSSENSLESEKIVETIYGFIPDLKRVVFDTLPAIQENHLDPVLDFLEQYPQYESTHRLLDSQQLQKRFDETEKEALDLWGVSFFASDDPGGYLGLSSIIGQEELANLQEMVERTGTDSIVFSSKVDELAKEAEEAYHLIQIIKEMSQLHTETRALCISISQSLMKIKMRAWEVRSNRSVRGEEMRLDEAHDLQSRAPQEADSILTVVEAIMHAQNPYTKDNLRMFRDLREQASDLQDRIVAFVEFGKDEAAPVALVEEKDIISIDFPAGSRLQRTGVLAEEEEELIPVESPACECLLQIEDHSLTPPNQEDQGKERRILSFSPPSQRLREASAEEKVSMEDIGEKTVISEKGPVLPDVDIIQAHHRYDPILSSEKGPVLPDVDIIQAHHRYDPILSLPEWNPTAETYPAHESRQPDVPVSKDPVPFSPTKELTKISPSSSNKGQPSSVITIPVESEETHQPLLPSEKTVLPVLAPREKISHAVLPPNEISVYQPIKVISVQTLQKLNPQRPPLPIETDSSPELSPNYPEENPISDFSAEKSAPFVPSDLSPTIQNIPEENHLPLLPPKMESLASVENDCLQEMAVETSSSPPLSQKDLSLPAHQQAQITILSPVPMVSEIPHKPAPVGSETPSSSIMADQKAKESLHQYRIPAVYETNRGVLFEGVTRQMDVSGLDFMAVSDTSPLPVGNEGYIHLAAGDRDYQFPGKIVRVSGRQVAIRILGSTADYATLVAQINA